MDNNNDSKISKELNEASQIMDEALDVLGEVGKSAYSHIQVSYEDNGVNYIHILAFDEETASNIEANIDRLESLQGHELYEEYRNLGAKPDDYQGVPARQEFDAQSKRLQRIAYYDNGLISDPDIGIPAEQIFNTKIGAVESATSWDNGENSKEMSDDEVYNLNMRNHEITPAQPDKNFHQKSAPTKTPKHITHFG